jgi:hypothetical protein
LKAIDCFTGDFSRPRDLFTATASRGKKRRGKESLDLWTLEQGFCDPNKWPEFKPNIQKFMKKFQFLGLKNKITLA